jgi:hypothetical protein
MMIGHTADTRNHEVSEGSWAEPPWPSPPEPPLPPPPEPPVPPPPFPPPPPTSWGADMRGREHGRKGKPSTSRMP